ncbi:hypothetical protein COJ96_05635 [Bacillus sp. AFS073361]|uniref:DUF3102 domain-containing protein n=1 Tax=Bacillus sp. AFS073361 TaxID=2033511 RepID=UPI000BF5C97D|nr:DUF3102 domain-containing protein [Bacillus sp. AFS073361]PFP30195.1 hypothetical protein COJ96_05635 [Bacillus sp. AFS073361]
MNSVTALSDDLHVITVEINSYKEVAGTAIFEIGKRLKHVKENDLAKGQWNSWCETVVGFKRQTANRFIQAFEQFGNGTTSYHIESGKIFELISLPAEVDRVSFLKEEHVIPSTKEVKMVDEMTVRELREVKKALKAAEAQRELALRDAQILRDTLESIEDKEPEVEVRTEYVEVKDGAAEEKLRKYEERFGDIGVYEGTTTRVTNGDAITYAVFEFSEDVRKFVEKYSHLPHFAREFSGMIGEGKSEYQNAIQAMFSLMKSIERNLSEEDVLIINQ